MSQRGNRKRTRKHHHTIGRRCPGTRSRITTAILVADAAALESHLALKSAWGMNRRGNRKRPATFQPPFMEQKSRTPGVALGLEESHGARAGGATQADYHLSLKP